VLLEQPELHLHPKVQSRLADFLAMARPDIRLLVETHSEYLITRLRLRVAEKALPQEDVAALFASQRLDAEADAGTVVHTEFRKLSVDEFGDFSAWPEDFFDSLDTDSVALANAVARRLHEHSPRDHS
jgi:predicted ATPase